MEKRKHSKLKMEVGGLFTAYCFDYYLGSDSQTRITRKNIRLISLHTNHWSGQKGEVLLSSDDPCRQILRRAEEGETESSFYYRHGYWRSNSMSGGNRRSHQIRLHSPVSVLNSLVGTSNSFSDIKPANYACGLGEKKRIIYLLDFGIARRILNDENELKTPRAQAGFKGTVRFASLSCHKRVEMGPKDDCERWCLSTRDSLQCFSWFYLLLDLTVVTGLPWRKIGDKTDVFKCKEESRLKRDKLFHGLSRCQDALNKILDYIDSLTYSDKVDYNFIYALLKIVGSLFVSCTCPSGRSRMQRQPRCTIWLGNRARDSQWSSENIWKQQDLLSSPHLTALSFTCKCTE